MRKAGKLAAETLDFITKYVKPGVTTEKLDKLCHNFIVNNNKNWNCKISKCLENIKIIYI